MSEKFVPLVSRKGHLREFAFSLENRDFHPIIVYQLENKTPDYK